MAIPTISSVSPSTCWTGGQLLTIVGTNFRTATIPSSVGQTGPLDPPLPSVKVTIDGEVCSFVQVLSATKLTAQAPAHDLGVVSIVVQNLDANGNPISGETATLTNGLTYARPALTDLPDLARLDRGLILELKRQVIANVLNFTSVDYAESPYDFAQLAQLPALVLSSPTLVESRNEYATNSEIDIGAYPDTEVSALKVPLTVDLQYELSGFTDNTRQAVSLQTLVAQFFHRNRRIKLLRDASDISKGYVYYDMEIPIGQPLRNTTEPNKSDIRSFTTSFTILGVVVEDISSFTLESLARKGGVVDSIEVMSLPLDD